jgi:hypothetical protein
MKIDIFTKVMLTLIAVALWGLLLQPFMAPKVVGASTGVIDVNVKQIDGRNINGSSLDVNLEKINGMTIYNALPVVIKK